MFRSLFIVMLLKCVYSRLQSITGNVLGGQYVNINNYPHSVALEMTSTYCCLCGGSILNQEIVLTAAHCFDDYLGRKKDTVLIEYGASARDHMSYVRMLYYRIHDKYDESTLDSDLAILRCKTPLRLGITAMRVAIMPSPPINDDIAFVSGWGTINNEMTEAKSLKHTIQKIQPMEICNKYLLMPKGSFCAGPLYGEGHPNEGDSGSALVIKHFIQIGIVSFKEVNYSLTVYTNVSHFYNWIKINAGKTYCANRSR